MVEDRQQGWRLLSYKLLDVSIIHDVESKAWIELLAVGYTLADNEIPLYHGNIYMLGNILTAVACFSAYVELCVAGPRLVMYMTSKLSSQSAGHWHW